MYCICDKEGLSTRCLCFSISGHVNLTIFFYFKESSALQYLRHKRHVQGRDSSSWYVSADRCMAKRDTRFHSLHRRTYGACRLHFATLPCGKVTENLTFGVFAVIWKWKILLFLITFSLVDVWIMLRDNWCSSLLKTLRDKIEMTTTVFTLIAWFSHG